MPETYRARHRAQFLGMITGPLVMLAVFLFFLYARHGHQVTR